MEDDPKKSLEQPASEDVPEPPVQEDPRSEPSSPPALPGPLTGGEQEIPENLPILPIRDAVAFPGTIMPLNIGRDKSRRLVETAISGNKLIGVVAQRAKEIEDPTLEHIFRVGTVCMILKMLTLPDGTLNIVVHGLVRFGIEEIRSTEPFMVAHVHTRPDEVCPSQELDALIHNVKRNAYRAFELSPNVPEEARVILDNIETAGGIADFLAANLPLSLENRQELLETFDVMERLNKVNAALAEHVEVLELSNKIQKQVRQQIDKTQREYFLQEQLKAIQKELGETDSRTGEIQRLKERVEQAQMPEAALKEAQRELERIARIPQASPEYSVAVDYVTWLCDLPWAKGTTDQLDLPRAERILDQDHYDLAKVKKRILEFLAVRKLKPDGRGPILCFLGPPGVGKTSLGQSIARALGRKFIRISLGGIHDEAQLRGHRRTYIGSMPGRIIQEIRKCGANNPVFMLDEVDKLGQDFRGDPASALLEILDPQQNYTFTDNYIDAPFDLSRVMFIATANYIDPIPPPLRDRMELIRLSGYTTQEKLFIAKRYLVLRQLEENGLTRKNLVFTDEALRAIIALYTREAGVRELERQIGTIARGVAARVARGQRRQVKITPDKLSDYLGPAQFDHEIARHAGVPGVATGLAFTPTGGEILFIEATRMPGRGNLTLTGQIGEVMKESAMTAWSIVRSRARQLHIDDEDMTKLDVHVHVPAGAIPKDGPSAGVGMLSALVSLFTGRPCRPDVAMTGEITLTGRVLPIGGVKEKVLAAHRAGIKRVILPVENKKDLIDIPEDIRRKKMKFTFVSDIDHVLRHTLMPASSAVKDKQVLPRQKKNAQADEE